MIIIQTNYMKHVITISEMAVQKLSLVLKDHNKSAIRFSVKGGGCNGFNYQLKPTDRPAETLDEVVKINNLEVQVCNSSIIHLLGTKIDWKEDIMGQGFHFENPMAQAKCGCGTSFSSKV